MIKLSCLGAAGSVTGSCYLVETPRGKKILVDCGLFQGGRHMEERNWRPWSFQPRDIDAVLLTHAHLDHSGRLPKLVRDGFRGRIVTSPPTAELCRIMLLDSAHIQEMDAEWQNRKNRRRNHQTVTPLYSVQDAHATLKYIHPQERDRMFDVAPGVKARLRNAGHILGSSIIELFVEDKDKEVKIVFSGDIGRNNQLIIKDPEIIGDADYVFIESTYGNRAHRSFSASKEELLEAINYAVGNGEKVIIPAFAVERTQEILYMLAEFSREGKLPDIPIFLDSPLAIKATEIFRRNTRFYDEDASAIVREGLDPFDLPTLRFTPTNEESMAINALDGPAIIIAGSGMCTAGRVKHHLKHNLWKEGASIVFVGFQAQGTPGRQIIDGKKWVKLFWQNVAVRARVFSIGGFSAHADQNELLEWIGNFAAARPRVFVVHGEPASSEELARAIRSTHHLETMVPHWNEQFLLRPDEVDSEPLPEVGGITMTQEMMLTVGRLENDLFRLRGQLDLEGEADRFTFDDAEHLKDLEEDLRSILAER